MDGPRSVTGLAPQFRSGCPWVSFNAMQVFHKTFVNFFMAFHAGFSADIITFILTAADIYS